MGRVASGSGVAERGVERRRVLAGAALRVLAAEGARGLTHRAVDDAAGLPRGSVNYYVSTREQLVRLAMEELFRHDWDAAVLSRPGRRTFARTVADIVEALTAPGARASQQARHELLMESRRDPVVRAEMAAKREAFVRLAAGALRADGCTTPRVHADTLVAFVDGLVLRQLYTEPPLSQAAIRRAVTAHLAGC